MTTLDDLKLAWDRQERLLSESLRLNRELLAAVSQSRLRAPLRGLEFSLALEIAVSAALLVVTGGFLARHVTEIRFVWPAALLGSWLILNLALAIRQLIESRSIDFAGPVAATQSRLAALRMLRLRSLRFLLLTGQIVWWLPFLIVSLKLFFGVDAYRFLSPGFIAANLAAGLAFIPAAVWLARRLEARWENSSLLRGVSDTLAGRSLSETRRRLADLQAGPETSQSPDAL